MSGRTYRYFKGDPLYPFGYGLSYTTFAYNNLNIKQQYTAGDNVKFSIDVKNTGAIAGDEVAQVYISAKDAGKIIVPLRSLKAFKRIHLQPGETKTISFTLPPDAFSIINEINQKIILKGKYEITAGGGQPGTSAEKYSNIQKKEITIL
jgi:beta-glucosidase